MTHNQPDQQETDLPIGLSMPARRALVEAGYTQLEQLVAISEAEVKQLHGMGPKAIGQLRDALGTIGLSFADDLGKPKGELTSTGNESTQATQQEAKPNAAIERLGLLVGEWRTAIAMPLDPPILTGGQTAFEWLRQGPFLIQRGSVEHPDFPTGIAIIGSDDSNDIYSMLYFDSRGISRIYGMSLSEEVWKLWRESPGFSQRFTGTFSGDGNTITGFWERSSDGSNWELDFDLTYTKVK